MPHRIIDVPIESLPFIDEHWIEIAAKPDEVWDALIRTVAGVSEARSGAPMLKALGCEETVAEGETGRDRFQDSRLRRHPVGAGPRYWR